MTEDEGKVEYLQKLSLLSCLHLHQDPPGQAVHLQDLHSHDHLALYGFKRTPPNQIGIIHHHTCITSLPQGPRQHRRGEAARLQQGVRGVLGEGSGSSRLNKECIKARLVSMICLEGCLKSKRINQTPILLQHLLKMRKMRFRRLQRRVHL